MALSRTTLLTPASVVFTSTFTTASFTPSNSSLILLLFGGYGTTMKTNYTSVSISGGSLTWTRQVHIEDTNTGDSLYAQAWTAPVSTGSSMTISMTSGTFINESHWQVYGYTGYNTSTPVGATGSAQYTAASGSGSSIACTLSGSPASTSECVSFVNIDGTTATVNAGTGWSALANDSGNGKNQECLSFYRDSSTSTDATTGSYSGGTGFGDIILALEIVAAGGGETITIDKWWQPPFYLPRKTELVGY